jgi:hypothetical protein
MLGIALIRLPKPITPFSYVSHSISWTLSDQTGKDSFANFYPDEIGTGNALALWNPPRVVRFAEFHGASCCSSRATKHEDLPTIFVDLQFVFNKGE